MLTELLVTVSVKFSIVNEGWSFPPASRTPDYVHNIPGADKSLARTTSQCILFDDENISFDASLVIDIYTRTYIVIIFLQLW